MDERDAVPDLDDGEDNDDGEDLYGDNMQECVWISSRLSLAQY